MKSAKVDRSYNYEPGFSSIHFPCILESITDRFRGRSYAHDYPVKVIMLTPVTGMVLKGVVIDNKSDYIHANETFEWDETPGTFSWKIVRANLSKEEVTEILLGFNK